MSVAVPLMGSHSMTNNNAYPFASNGNGNTNGVDANRNIAPFTPAAGDTSQELLMNQLQQYYNEYYRQYYQNLLQQQAVVLQQQIQQQQMQQSPYLGYNYTAADYFAEMIKENGLEDETEPKNSQNGTPKSLSNSTDEVKKENADKKTPYSHLLSSSNGDSAFSPSGLLSDNNEEKEAPLAAANGQEEQAAPEKKSDAPTEPEPESKPLVDAPAAAPAGSESPAEGAADSASEPTPTPAPAESEVAAPDSSSAPAASSESSADSSAAAPSESPAAASTESPAAAESSVSEETAPSATEGTTVAVTEGSNGSGEEKDYYKQLHDYYNSYYGQYYLQWYQQQLAGLTSTMTVNPASLHHPSPVSTSPPVTSPTSPYNLRPSKPVEYKEYVVQGSFNRLTGRFQAKSSEDHWAAKGLPSDSEGRQLAHWMAIPGNSPVVGQKKKSRSVL